jgi:hypothetical protein
MTGRGRGFASLSPEQRREVACAGASALREYGLANRFTSATARAAGARGLATRRALAAQARATHAELSKERGRPSKS